jgi:hypothetical protein
MQTNEVAKSFCLQAIRSNEVETHTLSPMYTPAKMRQILSRIGFTPDLIEELSKNNFYPIAIHKTLLKHFLEKDVDHGLPNIIQWVYSMMKDKVAVSSIADRLTSTLKWAIYRNLETA